MKVPILASIACCMVSVCLGQTDTIYTVDNQKIVCNYEEIAGSCVYYKLAGDDELRSLNVDQVHKMVLDDGAATIYIDYSDFAEDRNIKNKKKNGTDNNHKKTVIVCSDGGITYKKDKDKSVEIDESGIRVIKNDRIVEIKVR